MWILASELLDRCKGNLEWVVEEEYYAYSPRTCAMTGPINTCSINTMYLKSQCQSELKRSMSDSKHGKMWSISDVLDASYISLRI